MKIKNVIFTLLYMTFLSANVIIVSIAVVMITKNGQASTGIMLLFIEAMIYLSIRQEANDALEAS